jgi:hypothetical protein
LNYGRKAAEGNGLALINLSSRMDAADSGAGDDRQLQI